MNDKDEDEDLMHITTDDIERAQIEIFKKEFNIHGSSSESLLKNFPETPEKKVGKSSVSLKKKKKSKSILSSNKALGNMGKTDGDEIISLLEKVLK